jgi:acyl dehydratase
VRAGAGGAVKLEELPGTSLGTRTVTYQEKDAILYALAVGAAASELDLVFERQLRVLPTFALTLGLWVADAVSELGVFVPAEALHSSQQLQAHRPLPRAGEVSVTGLIEKVWDTGRHAIIDVRAESDWFSAVYSVVLLQRGGFGGAAPPRAAQPAQFSPAGSMTVMPQAAALYRLTGDKHLIHIDPSAAKAAGFDQPILHGLATLGMTARHLAGAFGSHPADLQSLSARFVAPVFPGDQLDVKAADGAFQVSVGDRTVLTGTVSYSNSYSNAAQQDAVRE